jgi:PAS domain S-box-containing protein
MEEKERKAKIIIADDEEGIRITLSAILSSAGYSVSSVKTGNELFSFLRKQRFDLIILDMVLPDADGLMIIPAVKKIAPLTSIILITAYASLESAISALNLGAQGYLMKPLDIPSAKQLISGVIARVELERKKEELELKLRHMADRYRSLVDNLQEGIYISTPEGKLKEVNAELVRIGGYSSKEDNLKVNTAELYVSPEDQENFKRVLEEKGAIKNYETRYRRKDGSIFNGLETCVAIRDKKGKIIEYQGTITDITEKKKLERKLSGYTRELERKVEQRSGEIKRAEEELRTIIETMNEGLVTVTPNLVITGANRKIVEMFGYQLNEFIGRNALDFFTKESGEQMKKEVREKRPKGISSSYEVVGITKDGRRLDILISGAPRYDDEGKLIGSVGVLTDISRLKQLEKELKKHADELEQKVEERTRKLRESETRYCTLFENVREGVFITDPGGRIIEANPGFLSLFGYQSKEQVIGAKILLENSLNKNGYKIFQKRAEKESWVSGVELSFRRRDGAIFHALLSGSAITGERGKPKRYLGTIIDITNRKMLEMKIRDALDYVENIIESSHDIIITVDLSRRVITFNRAAELAFGYLRDEVLGQTANMLYVDEKQGEMIFNKTLNKGRFEGEVVNRRKNGEIFYSHLNCSCLKNRKGELIGIIGISYDITMEKELTEEKERYTRELERSLKELKETQDQLIQMEKMASLGQLIAGIAHEIRNPISFILANLRALAEYQPTLKKLYSLCEKEANALLKLGKKEQADKIISFLSGEKIKETINDIVSLASQSIEGAERLSRLVADLKKFSRMDRGEFITTDVNACLDTALGLLENELKYKTEVIKKYRAIPVVLSAAGRLEQVFMNIILNAAQAIEKKGTIKITTGKKGGNVIIKIADTGCGISRKEIAHIFDPFLTTKPRDKGTGLGLTIAYNIIKQHGGDITVTSKKGKGTTFTVILPQSPPPITSPLIKN